MVHLLSLPAKAEHRASLGTGCTDNCAFCTVAEHISDMQWSSCGFGVPLHGRLCWDVCSSSVHMQVASLGRQLLQERTKVKALSEELESPLNVHR
jgi:hypothetical protein